MRTIELKESVKIVFTYHPNMHALPQKFKLIQRHAATLMLVMMVYQLGACPCGCLEHSAWAELLGTESANHSDDVAVGVDGRSSAVVSDATHDCTGEARVQYLNNNRVPTLQGPLADGVFVVLIAVAVLSLNSFAAKTHRSRTGSKLAFAAALGRPALQIYLV
ncbi:hypothetical protein [Thalassoroseus pseudoceratinae]|uniref:hypothetical protein n=1 Tax=Thalassoroseus pseudoceratinae TaxID=2713176 RepID=UPI001422AD96|nr:hypothetical protein [Thalassoroseus pseudoceratinae]